ncbi:hypothetical protein [Pseudomonas amygdali]|nr:hypothetical protein [Pseudomonas amygdali]
MALIRKPVSIDLTASDKHISAGPQLADLSVGGEWTKGHDPVFKH